VVTNLKPTLAGPSRPLGSPEIPQFHLPTGASTGVYTPRLYGAARIQFRDRKRRIDELRRVAYVVGIDPSGRAVDWESAQAVEIMPEQLLKALPVAANYLPLPAGAMDLNVFTRWAKRFDRWLARTQKLETVSKTDPPETVSLGPKRGGVSVELVAIVWDLT
jgi:hypothetical protein